EELEALRREVNRPAADEELQGIPVEHAVPELDAHSVPPEKARNLPGLLQRLGTGCEQILIIAHRPPERRSGRSERDRSCLVAMIDDAPLASSSPSPCWSLSEASCPPTSAARTPSSSSEPKERCSNERSPTRRRRRGPSSPGPRASWFSRISE